MNIYDPVITIFLANGKVVLVYSNGYYIRDLNGSAGTSVYAPHDVSEPKGAKYWKAEALKYLGCTSDDILAQTRGKISFKH